MTEKGYALITGSGSGIGRAIALALAESGFPTVVNDIDKGSGQKVVDEIIETGGEAHFIHADVSDGTGVKEMFDDADRLFGPPRVLVNNAGTPGKFALLADMEDADWSRNIAVHINGAFFCLRQAARRMAARGGHIVNIASIAGLHGTVGSGAYAAAKAAVINLTKTAAKELAPQGITVNAIAPGMVATPINQKLADQGSSFITAALAGVPSGRMTEPAEIAGLVAHLSTGGNSITGQIIALDGGASISAEIDRFMLGYLGDLGVEAN